MTIGSSCLAGVGTFTLFGLFEIGEATFEEKFMVRFLFHSLFGFLRSAQPIISPSQNAFPSA